MRLSRTTLIAFHDILVGVGAFWVAVWLASSFQWQNLSWGDRVVYTVAVAAVLHAVSLALGAYATVWRHFATSTVRQTLWRSIVSAAAILGTLFLYDRLANVSRSSAALSGLLLFFVWLMPRWVYNWWRSRGRMDAGVEASAARIPVLLVGGGPLALALADWLRGRAKGGGPYPVGFLDDDIPPGRRIGDLPVLGRPADVRRVLGMLRLRGESPRWILVVDDGSGMAPRSLGVLEEVARQQGIRLDFAPALPVAPPPPPTGMRVTMTKKPGVVPSTWLRLRSVADRVAGLAMLICATPVIALSALVVGWHLGRPVCFGQWRIGRGCIPFRIVKFRTMRDVVDDHGNVAPAAERVTPLGRWIRRLRIDEILQLWNVTRGEMVLIGPRPLVLEDVLDMPEQGRDRFVVPPGVTGWAQVNGGNHLNPEEKYAMDLWYIEHASPFLDVRIVWRTLLTMLQGERRDERAIAEALAWYRERRSGEHSPAAASEVAA